MSNSLQPDKNDDYVIQDGIKCPKKSPFPRWVSMITGFSFIPFFLIMLYYLIGTDYITLIIWIAGFIIFAIPLRYFACARCPYYGEYCSTTMGKSVTHLFKKQENKPMKRGMQLDHLIFLIVHLIPVYGLYDAGGWIALSLWIAVYILNFLLISGIACYYCPLTFCPIHKIGKRFWALFGRRYHY